MIKKQFKIVLARTNSISDKDFWQMYFSQCGDGIKAPDRFALSEHVLHLYLIEWSEHEVKPNDWIICRSIKEEVYEGPFQVNSDTCDSFNTGDIRNKRWRIIASSNKSLGLPRVSADEAHKFLLSHDETTQIFSTDGTTH